MQPFFGVGELRGPACPRLRPRRRSPALIPAFTLLFTPILVDETAGGVIVVDEERAPDPLSSAAAVSVLPIDERLPASADLGELLNRAAGARVQRMGGLGDFSAVSVRGSDLRQVQIYIDGVPLNPDGASVVNLSELPLRAFSRAELWRANAPAELAAAPIGGVVNLVVAEDPPPFSGGLTLGSLSTTRLDGLAAGPRVLAYAEAFNTRGDFLAFSDNGTPYNRLDDQLLDRANNDKAQLSTFVRIKGSAGPADLVLLESYLDREEGLPGPIRNPAATPRLATRRNLAVASARASLGPTHLQARAWQQLRLERLDDPKNELGVGRGGSEHRFSSTGLVLHGALPSPLLTGGLTLSARRDGVVERLPTPEDPRRRDGYTAALSGRAYLAEDRLHLEAVLQENLLDNRFLGELPWSELPIAPDDEQWITAFTPRFAASLALQHNVVLRCGGGRYLRPPDLTELFGDQGYLIGNSALRSEQGWQADLGLRWAIDGPVQGLVELGGFGSYVDDRIVLVQNAQYTSIPVNFGLSRALGVEASATLSALGWLELGSALTFTDTRNLTPSDELFGEQLPRVPRLELSQTTALVWRDRARLSHTYSYASASALDATNWSWSAPRSLHAVSLRVRPTAAPLWVELSVLNAANHIAQTVPLNPLDPADDERVLLPVSDFSDYPLPGRTLLLSLRWPN